MIPEWEARSRQLFFDLGEKSPFETQVELEGELSQAGLTNQARKHETSIHHVFSKLSEICIAAHERRDEAALANIYGFAHWCWDQDVEAGQDLGNAVGVSFFETIVRSPAVRQELPKWLSPSLFRGLKGLLGSGVFLSADEWEELRCRCGHLEE